MQRDVLLLTEMIEAAEQAQQLPEAISGVAGSRRYRRTA